MAPHVKEQECPPCIGNDSIPDSPTLWSDIRFEAKRMAEESSGDLTNSGSQILPHFLDFTILKRNSLEECLATHLSEKLGWKAVPAESWFSVLMTAFRDGASSKGEPIISLIRKDLRVIKERDPACPSHAHALLHYKGFQGLQAYRAANWLWRNGENSLASIFQSRVSEVFGLDIHPAAQIGGAIMIDHGTGVVIGETAVVGNGCTLLHGVTLGGTGKQSDDRHPKLGINVLVGAGASILGNVKIGDCAKIGAAALVLTSIPPCATAVGCPAKVIGRVSEENPASGMDSICKQVEVFMRRSLCPFRKLDCKMQGYLGPNEFASRLREVCKVPITTIQASETFFKMDTDRDGLLTESEFNDNIDVLQDTLSEILELAEPEKTTT